MRACLLLFCLVLSPECYSQKVYFTDSTNRWYVERTYSHEDPTGPQYTAQDRYFYSDTVHAHGQVYLALDQYGTSTQYPPPWQQYYKYTVALIREDTSIGKVLARVFDFGGIPTNDTSEVVLYDYNLQLGDTFQLGSNTQLKKTVVTQVDSITINGVIAKRWKLKYLFLPISVNSLTVIEGVGAIEGPLRGYDYPIFEAGWLDCFTNKDVGLFTNNPTWYKDCLLDVDDVVIPSLQLFPNPNFGAFTIRTHTEGLFRIHDMQGRLISTHKLLKGSNVMAMPAVIPHGIYFASFISARDGKQTSINIYYQGR